MRRIITVVKVRGMARIAGGGSSLKDIVGVTCDASQRRVRAGERVPGVLQMVKLGIEPTVHRMAALAGSWKTEPNVIQNGGQKVLLVAGVAGGGQASELPDSSLLMAFFALHQGMRANEREAVLVILNGFQRSLPARYGMATGAVGAELAAMYVGMAIGALRTYILEHQVSVALAAAHLLMHTAQRISRLVVIEFGVGPYRFPAGVRVAIGTRC